MKKLLSLLLALAMVLVLAACGGNEPDPTTQPTTTPTTTPTTQPTTEPATEPADTPDVVGTRYEAEDATMEGEFNPYGFGNENGREDNEDSSGGAHIGFFSTVGNTITWNINADSDANVTLVFCMASCDQNADLALDGHVTVTVNGTALDLAGKVVAGDPNATETNYTYFQEVTFENVALTSGANTIVIECVSVGDDGAETFNVDYVEVVASATEPAGTPDVVGIRYEAEDATMEGEFNPYGFGNENGREDNEGSSGGAHIGFFSTVGNTITWNINADSDASVTLVFCMASCDQNADLALEGHVTVTVNGTALDLTDKVVAGDPNATETNYTYFQVVTFENVSLTAGANTIVIECVSVGDDGAETFNVDYVEVIGADQHQ